MHVPHEEGGHALEAERAYAEFVLPPWYPKGGLVYVGLTYPELVVRTGEVELGEPRCSPCFVDQLFDVGKRLYRLLGNGVEAPIILAEASRAVSLSRKHH